MPFTPAPLPSAEPRVTPDEIVRPTRVVWRHPENRRVTSRVFATEARAFAFAADQREVIVVQDARERPPAQDTVVNYSFTDFGSGQRCAVMLERLDTNHPRHRKLPQRTPS